MTVPASRPKWDRAKVEQRLAAAECPDWPVRLLGVRGYFADTLGVRGVNDIGVYDDAIFLVTPDRFHAYNANCDPSVEKPNVATLIPGVWWYRVDWHRGEYLTLVQDTPVTVERFDNNDADDLPQIDTGWFGINIHPAGLKGAGSLGCQTIPTPKQLGAPNDQWREFFTDVLGAMGRHGVRRVVYTLIEENG